MHLSLRWDLSSLAGFLLALTVSLPLPTGAAELPLTDCPQSALGYTDSCTVYTLRYSEKVQYSGEVDEEFQVPQSWRRIPLMFSNDWQEVTLKHCNWNVAGYGKDADGNYIAYTDYPDVLRTGEKYVLEVVWELKLYHERNLADFSLEQSGTFDDMPRGLVQEYTKAEGVWTDAMLDERIRETAFALRDDCVLQTLYNIIGWVGGNIGYMVSDTPQYPEDVYYTRKGECEDTSNLLVAFCRILGIPAWLEVGFGMEPDWDGEWSNELLHFSWLNYYPAAWAKVYVPNIGWLPVDWVASYRPGGPRTVKGAITQADILKPNFCLYYVNAHCDPMTERKEIFLGWNEGMLQKLYGHEMYLEVSVELVGVEPGD